MQYYKSSSGGVYKVYACDPTTGKSTIVLNYKNTGMYNVINQQFSIVGGSGTSDYDMHISSLETSTRTEFLALADPAKVFLNGL